MLAQEEYVGSACVEATGMVDVGYCSPWEETARQCVLTCVVSTCRAGGAGSVRYFRGLCSAAAGRRPPPLGDGFVRRSDRFGLWAELPDVRPQDPKPPAAAVVWGVCENERPACGDHRSSAG